MNTNKHESLRPRGWWGVWLRSSRHSLAKADARRERGGAVDGWRGVPRIGERELSQLAACRQIARAGRFSACANTHAAVWDKPRPVASTFLSAGNGDFPVTSSLGGGNTSWKIGRHGNTELESSVNPQTGMFALPRCAPPLASQRLPIELYTGTLSGLPFSAAEIFRMNGAAVFAHWAVVG